MIMTKQKKEQDPHLTDAQIEASWRAAQDCLAGKIQAIPADECFARLREKHKRDAALWKRNTL